MWLRNILKPFGLCLMLGVTGYLLFGGALWLWGVGVWLGSVPIIILWNWPTLSRSKTPTGQNQPALSALKKRPPSGPAR